VCEAWEKLQSWKKLRCRRSGWRKLLKLRRRVVCLEIGRDQTRRCWTILPVGVEGIGKRKEGCVS